MNAFLWMALFYVSVGALLMTYGVWGFRQAKAAETDRAHALGMHAAGFGIPCGAIALAGGVVWIVKYAYLP